MKKIILAENKVNYGVFDELIDFNYNEFILQDFFGGEITGLRRKFAIKNFNYFGFISDSYCIGFAVVSLGYVYNIFCYMYDFQKGMLFSYDTKGLDNNSDLKMEMDPDKHTISFAKGKSRVQIEKSHLEKKIQLNIHLDAKLSIEAEIPFSLSKNKPLRVINPSDPYRWTFTEKSAPLIPKNIHIRFQGENLNTDSVGIVYDWTGGFLRRETNWYWASLGNKKLNIGWNFAALVNESYFSENAYWVDGERTRIPRVIFDFSHQDPYKNWKLFDEDKNLEIIFEPVGERREKMNVIFSKLFFRQFFGKFSGKLKTKNGKMKTFKDIWGFTEIHRSLW